MCAGQVGAGLTVCHRRIFLLIPSRIVLLPPFSSGPDIAAVIVVVLIMYSFCVSGIVLGAHSHQPSSPVRQTQGSSFPRWGN